MTTPAALSLYDSLKKEKRLFEPVVAGKVSMYLCGPTTYDSAHIGHAYSALCFDVIRRCLLWLGYDVRFVRNITDVDDKIITRSNESGEPPLELAARYADEYNRDMGRFGILAPDEEPRVSEHIEEIVSLIETLVANGKAYAVGGDVYFEVSSFAPYGRLSGQSIDDLVSGSRVEVDGRKRAATDFALWKSAKPGEPSWPSPWGQGRPGWHIECSAMVAKHLGETFDIHGGGKDLVFPHHENEIAQSQGAFGEGTFARYWMHNGFLNFSGEKMSKSIGNVLGCPDIANSCGAEAMRMFVVSHHYRSPVNFDMASGSDGKPVFRDLEAADKRLDYFYGTLRRIDDFLSVGKDPGDGEVVAEAEVLVEAARQGLCDDFNTPIVMAALGEAAKTANRLLDGGKGIAKPVRRRSLSRLAADLRSVGGALGILGSDPVQFQSDRRSRLCLRRGIDASQIESLLEQRGQARVDKDFAKADELRDQLTALGVEVLDTSTGVDWRITD